MNGQDEKNLSGCGGLRPDEKELFEKFIGSSEAEKAVEVVRRGEQILRENPAPQPSSELIDEIKYEIARGLLQKRTGAYGFRRTAYKVAAAAAVVIIITAISTKFFIKSDEPYGPVKTQYASVIPTSFWDSEDVVTDDADLAILTAEIEQIEGEMLALQLGRSESNSQTTVTELEMELEEIESDFWKG